MHHENHDRSMAISATLHCLTGCAIGEIVGLIIGTAFALHVAATTALAIALAFVFGFSLSALPLVKAGISIGAALSLVTAADTLSIATMELVDNLVMVIIPGAVEAGLVDPLFWISMALALTAAFFAALPVNARLLARGKGHAVTMEALNRSGGGHPDNKPLLYGLIGFLAGGLLVALAHTML